MPRYLGQHFLVDQQVLQGIVAAISDMIQEHTIQTMWEIGPGQGALTQHIWQLTKEFCCFEKDETMSKHLRQFLQPEQIVWGDVLVGTISDTPGIVVGNLPYYITSPIFRKFFTEDIEPVGGVFLIQKEVAEKIASDAKKKSYLWWLLNNKYTVDYLFTVPPEAFDPPPKVDSAVVILKRGKVEKLNNEVYKKMLLFLDFVSPYKRKTLGKIQKMLQKKDIDLQLPAGVHTKRLEELSRDEMQLILK